MYTLRGLSKFWRMDVVEVPALQAVQALVPVVRAL